MAQTISIQPLSAPSGTLFYMDYKYGDTKPVLIGKKCGRKCKMKIFKIKYTNNKGIIKTRSIKATSEQSAMSKIKDLSQHHYTIEESVDDEPGGGLGTIPSGVEQAIKIWSNTIYGITSSGKTDSRRDWLNKYALAFDSINKQNGISITASQITASSNFLPTPESYDGTANLGFGIDDLDYDGNPMLPSSSQSIGRVDRSKEEKKI